MVAAAAAGALILGCNKALWICGCGVAGWHRYPNIAANWVLADFAGVLLVAPVIMTSPQTLREILRPPQRMGARHQLGRTQRHKADVEQLARGEARRGRANVADADIDLMAPTRVASRTRGDKAAIEAAAALLAGAQRPVIMAGDAVAQTRAHAELVALAEVIGAPVYAEFVPNTASFPASHPLFRGAMTRLAETVRTVLADHDLLLSVGGDLLTLSLPSAVDPIPPGLTIIQLDTDAWELGKNYAAEVALLAPALGNPPAGPPKRRPSGAAVR